MDEGHPTNITWRISKCFFKILADDIEYFLRIKMSWISDILLNTTCTWYIAVDIQAMYKNHPQNNLSIKIHVHLYNIKCVFCQLT